MKTTHRSYAEELGDFNRLAHFVVEHNDEIRTYSTWCIGRLVDWKYGLYESKTAAPDFCARNAELWFDGLQRLAGFVISEYGGADCAIITRAGYRFLFEEMLACLMANWGDRDGALSIEITDAQTIEAEVLAGCGFQHSGQFTRQAFDLTGKLRPSAPLPADFEIVDMATHPDYLAQRILRDNAFRGKNDLSDAELQRELLFYNHMHTGPIYHPQADLCVRAADGRYVAGCEALIDAHNAAADIERVCTHSDFRQRGLARAVIHAMLAQLKGMGLRTAYITGYSQAAIALYDSIGAGEASMAHIYRLAEA